MDKGRYMQMTSAERVSAVINGRDFDVYPAINPTSVATVDAMKLSGAFFPEAHTDPAKMAALACVGRDVFGFDSVTPYFSILLEASALGADVDWGNIYEMPSVIKKPIKRPEEYEVPKNFLSRREFSGLLKVCSFLKKKYKNEVPVIGKVIGPWSLAYHLYGVENLVLDTILEPEKTAAFINTLSEIPMAFAKAQFEAGADMLLWADHVTSDLVSAEIYRKFIMPIHKKAAAELQQYGPIILHTCGNVADRLMYIADTGFKIFHMDSKNDIEWSVGAVGKDMLITGCINNPVLLAQGDPPNVKKAVEENIRQGIKLISPECALPFSVPADNLLALTKTAHSIRPE